MATKRKGLIRDEEKGHLDQLAPSSNTSSSQLNQQKPKVGKKQLKIL